MNSLLAIDQLTGIMVNKCIVCVLLERHSMLKQYTMFVH